MSDNLEQDPDIENVLVYKVNYDKYSFMYYPETDSMNIEFEVYDSETDDYDEISITLYEKGIWDLIETPVEEALVKNYLNLMKNYHISTQK